MRWRGEWEQAEAEAEAAKRGKSKASIACQGSPSVEEKRRNKQQILLSIERAKEATEEPISISLHEMGRLKQEKTAREGLLILRINNKYIGLLINIVILQEKTAREVAARERAQQDLLAAQATVEVMEPIAVRGRFCSRIWNPRVAVCGRACNDLRVAAPFARLISLGIFRRYSPPPRPRRPYASPSRAWRWRQQQVTRHALLDSELSLAMHS